LGWSREKRHSPAEFGSEILQVVKFIDIPWACDLGELTPVVANFSEQSAVIATMIRSSAHLQCEAISVTLIRGECGLREHAARRTVAESHGQAASTVAGTRLKSKSCTPVRCREFQFVNTALSLRARFQNSTGRSATFSSVALTQKD